MPTETPKNDVAVRNLIAKEKRNLDEARAHGDQLHIDLAEAALNDALERLLQVT